MTDTITDTHIRWLIRRDLDEVMPIDKMSYPVAWTLSEFHEQLRKRACIALVAERGDKGAGFVIYELHSKNMTIISLGVHPIHRRTGVATAIIDKLKSKLDEKRRKTLVSLLNERNLDGQLFLKEKGFEAVKVHPREYEDGSAAYEFRYEVSDG